MRTWIDERIGKNRNFEPSFPSCVIYSLATAMQLRRSWKIHANFNLDNSPRHSEEAFSGNLPCLPIHVIYKFIYTILPNRDRKKSASTCCAYRKMK